MMRSALCAAALLLSADPASAQLRPDLAPAQLRERRGFIGIGIGPSVPVGNFADTSAANSWAGKAKPGYTDTFLNVGWRFGKRFGAAAAASYGEYSTYGVGDDDWWQVIGLTAGPMYSLPLGARGAVDFRAMLGVMITLDIIDSYATDARTGDGLMADLRTTVRYDLFRRWCVFAEGGLISARQSFPDGRRTDVTVLISGFGVAFRPMW